MVPTAEKNRQERNKARNRAQAQLVKNIVLQKERVNLKRARNSRDEEKPERQLEKPVSERRKQLEKRTSGISATTDDFVEVSPKEKQWTKKKKKTGEEKQGNPRVPVPHARKKNSAVSSVVIRPGADMTFAQIVKDLKQNVKPDVRKTAGGNIFLAFKSSTTSGKAFQEAVQKVVKEKGKVSLRTPKVTLGLRDLDETVTKEKVINALRTAVEGTCELDTHVIGPSPRGQMTTLVNTDPVTARKLLDKARVRVGWVNCRIRERVTMQRCFKCLGYGPSKAKCGGPDRSINCCPNRSNIATIIISIIIYY